METTSSGNIFKVLLSIVLFGICAFQSQIPVARLDVISSPTPTIDPLVEPILPDDPTELELGRNLYWHWCMTCHGDHGQGLTDEFRGIWEPEHQNCWARGCHTGRRDDLGFPIPTIVPAIVGGNHLSRFSSLQDFSDFLQATHPPQSPGILADQEYHAIALFVFTMNCRTVDSIILTNTPTLTSTATLIPVLASKTRSSSSFVGPVVIFVGVLIAAFIFLNKREQVWQKDFPDQEK
jgi:hypothetical protein